MKYIAIQTLAILLLTTHANCDIQTPSKAPPQMVTLQPESHYSNLKEIAWLVGTWEEKSDTSNILVTTKWDKYKNFIIQHYEWKIGDSDELELQQLIGWDPIQNKIHSWVFDSDGGYGEGTWTKTNDKWLMKMNFILPDGRKGTATNVYNKIDDNTYTFSSFGRDIDGEILPNIKPVTLIKKQQESL